MYPQDVKEFTASRLVAAIAKALATGAPLELRPLYEELEIQPTQLAAWHAAAAAVHTLLASEASHATGTTAPQLAAPTNGHGLDRADRKKVLSAAGDRRLSQTKKSTSTPPSKRTTKAAPLKCSICGKPFMTADRLRNHMRDLHGGESERPQPSATAPAAG